MLGGQIIVMLSGWILNLYVTWGDIAFIATRLIMMTKKKCPYILEDGSNGVQVGDIEQVIV